MKAYLASILVFSLSIANAGSSQLHRLEVKLAKNDEIIVIEVRNISPEPVNVTVLQPGGSDLSALNLYMYDPVRKDLQDAYATSFPDKRGTRLPQPRLEPGAAKVLRFRVEDIERYFFRVPRCYFLVASYRDRRNGAIVSSAASNAVKVCTSNRRPGGASTPQ